MVYIDPRTVKGLVAVRKEFCEYIDAQTMTGIATVRKDFCDWLTLMRKP